MGSLSGALISQGLRLIASIMTARRPGKSGFCQLEIVNSAVGLFGTFAGFGLPMTTTKYVTEHRASHLDRAGRVITLTISVVSDSAALFAPVLIGFAHQVGVVTPAVPIAIVPATSGCAVGTRAVFLPTGRGRTKQNPGSRTKLSALRRALASRSPSFPEVL